MANKYRVTHHPLESYIQFGGFHPSCLCSIICSTGQQCQEKSQVQCNIIVRRSGGVGSPCRGIYQFLCRRSIEPAYTQRLRIWSQTRSLEVEDDGEGEWDDERDDGGHDHEVDGRARRVHLVPRDVAPRRLRQRLTGELVRQVVHLQTTESKIKRGNPYMFRISDPLLLASTVFTQPPFLRPDFG